MKMRMFQRTWHGIDLTSLPAAKLALDQPAGADFYTQFYQALASGAGKIEPGFLEGKRRLGEAVEQGIIGVWQRKHGRSPQILALAAGKAPVERVWSEHGYTLTFNECQEDSLAELRREFPKARFLIGDIYQLVPESKHDLITAISVDYVMSKDQLAGFLSRAAGWLHPGGQIILYCASTLSFRQMAVETLKQVLGFYRREPHVFWGYWRTPKEFYDAAARAGLRVVGMHGLTGDAPDNLQLKARPTLFRKFPPLRDPHLIVTLEPK